MTAGVLEGRAAVVSGAGSGLGRAIAQALSAAGAAVVVNDVRAERAAETVRLLTGVGGGRAVAAPGDVRRPEDVGRVVDLCARRFGRLDVLVNNAGVSPAGMVKTHASEDWRLAFDVNLGGTVLMSRAALPHLVRSGSGRIVNVSSQIAGHGMMNQSAYASSKAGVSALTKSLARICGRRGITVNAICPGAFPETSMVREFLSEWPEYEATLEFYDRLRPLPRRPRGEDVGSLAVFLAGDGAAYLNGQMIVLNGGFS